MIDDLLKKQVNYCDGPYSMLDELKANFSYNWTEYSAQYTPSSDMANVHRAFQYRSSDDLDSLPYSGIFTTYYGGGYVFDMIGNVSFIQSQLGALRNLNWFDRQTRTLIIEFNLYNPNINYFAVCTFVVEVLPTGNLIRTLTIDIINIFTKNSAVRNGIYYAYLGLVVWCIFREFKKMYRMKKLYLRQFWSWINWCIVATSLAAFAIWTYRTWFGQKLLESFSSKKGQ